MSGSLQQNVIDMAKHKRRKQLTACMRADGPRLEHFLWPLMTAKNRNEKIKCEWLGHSQKDVPLPLTMRDFQVPKVSQGKVCTLNKWSGKINHILLVVFVQITISANANGPIDTA